MSGAGRVLAGPLVSQTFSLPDRLGRAFGAGHFFSQGQHLVALVYRGQRGFVNACCNAATVFSIRTVKAILPLAPGTFSLVVAHCLFPLTGGPSILAPVDGALPPLPPPRHRPSFTRQHPTP